MQFNVFVSLLVALFASTAVLPSHAFLGFGGESKGSGTFAMFFHSFSYIFRKRGRLRWLRKATNDDIHNDKYIFVDLFSHQHHDAIDVVPLEDDLENKRTNILAYAVNPQRLPFRYANATLGDVMYYSQLLQTEGDYEERRVMTYKDELERFCALIESFDTSGARVSMRLYRVKRRMWWLKLVAKEGSAISNTWSSVMNYFGVRPNGPVKKQTLNIKESNCPLGMVNHKTSSYDIIYNRSPGAGVETIGDVIFRTMPQQLSPGCTDLYVWRCFAKDKRDDITYVVIAEKVGGYSNITYFKCTSPADSQYEEVDSFGSEGKVPTKLEVVDPFPHYGKSNVDMVYAFGPHLDHPYESDIFVVAYPDSHHYLIRPLATANLKIIKTFKVQGKLNSFDLEIPDADGYTFVSCTHLDAENIRRMSLTSVWGTRIALISGRISLEKMLTPQLPLVDQHSLYLLKHHIPVQYLRMTPDDALSLKNPIDFRVYDYDDADVLAAQFNIGMTFYTPNLASTTDFKSCIFHNDNAITLKKSYNTQVFLIEKSRTSLAIVLQAGSKELQVYEVGNKKMQLCDATTRFKHLKTNDLMDLEAITKRGVKSKPTKVSLNLNDPMLDGNIEITVLSTSTVMYTPINGNTRISAFVWGKQQLAFGKESSPVFTLISNRDEKFLLVDEWISEQHLVKRYLYAMEERPSLQNLRLLTQMSCEVPEDNLNDIRRCLQRTWFEMIPQRLPIVVEEKDSRIGNAEFPYHKLGILYLPHGHDFSLGLTSLTTPPMETRPGHKWRQVHSFKTDPPKTKASVFTMTPKGIQEDVIGEGGTIASTSILGFRRLTYSELPVNAVPLLLDNIEYSDSKFVVSKVGGVTVTVLKPTSSSSVFNPVVFGRHEIQFIGDNQCTRVTLSESEDGLREVSVDLKAPDGSNVILNFRERAPREGLFDFDRSNGTSNAVGSRFVDVNRLIYNYEAAFEALDVLDFNKGIFPHHIRYLTLNKFTMYFTGYISHAGLTVNFGSFELPVPASAGMFHAWVRYKTDNSGTATLYLHYVDQGKVHSTLHTVEESATAKALRRPREYNCNWGPMSNAEFYAVNYLLLRHTQVQGELMAVNLDLSSGDISTPIMKMKVDSGTTLYTTVATSGCVIDHVIHKGAIIRGVPKQLVKHVYHSHGATDDVLLVVVRTLKTVFAQAYGFSDKDSFQPMRLADIDPQQHPSIHAIMKSLA
ncbi:cf58 antigen [Babesia caballi]|uniref:Cf58 antigen n=1 Tax=Babesia caballi TaxID=5871 RepID=A0AAV4M0Q6_BABCB|nr:cf58 antigen [Babesia caballi]